MCTKSFWNFTKCKLNINAQRLQCYIYIDYYKCLKWPLNVNVYFFHLVLYCMLPQNTFTNSFNLHEQVLASFIPASSVPFRDLWTDSLLNQSRTVQRAVLWYQYLFSFFLSPMMRTLRLMDPCWVYRQANVNRQASIHPLLAIY